MVLIHTTNIDPINMFFTTFIHFGWFVHWYTQNFWCCIDFGVSFKNLFSKEWPQIENKSFLEPFQMSIEKKKSWRYGIYIKKSAEKRTNKNVTKRHFSILSKKKFNTWTPSVTVEEMRTLKARFCVFIWVHIFNMSHES